MTWQEDFKKRIFTLDEADKDVQLQLYEKVILIVDLTIILKKIEEKTKQIKWNYLTEKEAELDDFNLLMDGTDLQIVLGLQTCKTKEDVLELLRDVRKHERLYFLGELMKAIAEVGK